MPLDLVESIEQQFRNELDAARKKRREAEAHLRAVSAAVHRRSNDDSFSGKGVLTWERAPVVPGHGPVLGIRVGGLAKAYPFSLLTRKGVLNDCLGETGLLVTFDPVFAAPAVFRRTFRSGDLHFQALWDRADGLLLIRDEETGSIWQALTGRSIDGPLAGYILPEIESEITTTLDWQQRYPGTQFP